MAGSEFEKHERNTVRRQASRGKYDRETVFGILDEAFLCHVGFSVEGQPFVIPTLYARDGETIFIHGSSISRMLKNLSEGLRACVTVTITDGIVLARSAFHHSMNYRSVTIFGQGALVEDENEKVRALEVISENVLPGRWADSRGPTKKELDVTSVIAIRIEDAAAKIREGGPKDDKRDYELPIWAGVVPIVQMPLEPVADALLPEGIEVPDYIKKLYE
ncbi:MAG: pyridoxamine 5'-phosphate oxidase family protein [Acidobacteriota bacterium]|nr:MAG: pyridoxamine 5'-phosphate oxidase family protein [Acidobacteriota bacterium]